MAAPDRAGGVPARPDAVPPWRAFRRARKVPAPATATTTASPPARTWGHRVVEVRTPDAGVRVE